MPRDSLFRALFRFFNKVLIEKSKKNSSQRPIRRGSLRLRHGDAIPDVQRLGYHWGRDRERSVPNEVKLSMDFNEGSV